MKRCYNASNGTTSPPQAGIGLFLLLVKSSHGPRLLIRSFYLLSLYDNIERLYTRLRMRVAREAQIE